MNIPELYLESEKRMLLILDLLLPLAASQNVIFQHRDEQKSAAIIQIIREDVSWLRQ